MTNLFNLFGPSPIKPIEQHMHKVYQCVKQLTSFFEHAFEKNWDDALSIKNAIVVMEHEADAIKRDLRSHLPTGLFLPVARSDLLELIRVQDRIANRSKHIADLVLSRKMNIPVSLLLNFKKFLSTSIEAVHQACRAINELDGLLESGFSGNELAIVDEMVKHLDDLEHKTDQELSDIRHEIFLMEQQIPTIEVIFLYKLMQWVGDLADYAQSVGSRLQILIAR
jgi:predicted phosphate transport protein (TIGR00153 family)